MLCSRALLRRVAGSWKDKDHPELKDGTVAWVKKLRRESEARFKSNFGIAER